MKQIILILLCLSAPALAAQDIQQSSIDFLLSQPETVDVLLHAETWRYRSTRDNRSYTAVRYFSVTPTTRTRYCLILPEGAFVFPETHIGYWKFTYFLTNGQNMDSAMMDWCVG